MGHASKLPARDRHGGFRVWDSLQSFFAGAPRQEAEPVSLPVVALVVGEEDRRILAGIHGLKAEMPVEIHFAESCEDAWATAARLQAPVILFDRDWPGVDWRISVESLAALPHRPCVILLSGVADDYLWQELVRQGGYDVLAKPLRAGPLRIVQLALSYWNYAAERRRQERVGPGAGT